jgi:hypothetical protein
MPAKNTVPMAITAAVSLVNAIQAAIAMNAATIHVNEVEKIGFIQPELRGSR